MTTSEQRTHRIGSSTRTSSARTRAGSKLFATLPIVLAGSMAVGLGVTGPVQPIAPKRTEKPRTSPLELAKALRTSFTATRAAAPAAGEGTVTTAAAPATYKVVAGDSVSSIAGRFGLATASVLALNGLGWKSVIFPGQVLKLTNGGAVPVAATPTPAPSSGVTRYTIRAGDTMGAIASRFGVPTATLLSANGLGWSSIIYPGQTISIPSASSVAAAQAPVLQATNTVAVSPVRTPSVPGLTNEMMTNARTIVTVGRSLGVPDYGIVIALATALQESGLRNLNYGDRDSLGIFQQRPSTGWGTPAQVMDPSYSARLFFGGPTNPNKGRTRGLLDIPGWQTKTVAQAAQAVQLSAFPNAYAKWETTARAAFATLR